MNLRNILFILLLSFNSFSSWAELSQVASSIHEPEEKLDLKLYFGSFAMKQVDKMQSLSAGIDYAGRFSEDKFEFKNHYDISQFQMQDYYNKAQTSYQRHHISSTLMANLVADNLSFLTYIGAEKTQQSQKRSTNVEFNFGLIGITYWIYSEENTWREISVGYIPMYVFLNVNRLNSQNQFVEKNSREYLIHTFYFNLLINPYEEFFIRDHLSYGLVKNLKKGPYEMENNELKNQLDLVFQISKRVEIFYRSEYIQDKKRTTYYNLPASDLAQSLNFAYDFGK
jgi:hypothetical protein